MIGAIIGDIVGLRCGIASNNAGRFKYRIGILLRNHGPRCFERALREEAGSFGFGRAA